MGIIDILADKAKKSCPTIVFPEGEEEAIARAAEKLGAEGICKPIVLGDAEEIASWGVDLSHVTVKAPVDYDDQIDAWADDVAQTADMPSGMVAKRMRKKPLWLAAAMVAAGEVDGMVAGLTYSTSNVIQAGQMLIGLAKGVRIPSSYFLMDIPGWSGGEDGLMVYADCGVNVNPTSEELASIAETTADTTASLLGWEPRVAMLSFSTKGSGKHPDARKVVTPVTSFMLSAPISRSTVSFRLTPRSSLPSRPRRRGATTSCRAGRTSSCSPTSTQVTSPTSSHSA